VSEIAIRQHDFQNAKNQLQLFSQKTPKDLGIPTVATEEGLFGWFDHKVTGEELNGVISHVQKYLIDSNSILCSTIKEFGEIYNALEALDRDYISAILIAVKAAEEASNKAVKNQADINCTIDTQKKTIAVLQKFKDEISKCAHLTDVDKMWYAVKANEQGFQQLRKKADEQQTANEQGFQQLKKKTSDLQKANEKIAQSTETLQQAISGVEHLKDIDKTWGDVQKLQKCVTTLDNKLACVLKAAKVQAQVLEALQDFMDKLSSLKHLGDVDQIWIDTQTLHRKQEDLSDAFQTAKQTMAMQEVALEGLNQWRDQLSVQEHLGSVDQIWEDTRVLQQVQDDYDSEINAMTQTMEDEKRMYQKQTLLFQKKLKIVYMVAGGAATFSIIQFFLIILGVL